MLKLKKYVFSKLRKNSVYTQNCPTFAENIFFLNDKISKIEVYSENTL